MDKPNLLLTEWAVGMLFDFEWWKAVDGYRLETVNIDQLELTEGAREGMRRITGIKTDPPDWLQRIPGQRIPNSAYINQSDIEAARNNFDGNIAFLVTNSDNFVQYRPIDDYPALFMDLIGCGKSTENALRFISKYGLLNPYRNGGPASYRDDMPTSYRMGPFVAYGYLKSVHHASWRMREAYDLLKEYRESDAGKSDFVHQFTGLFKHMELDLVFKEKDENGLSMFLSPRRFSDAAWLQFGQAISANSNFQQCDECISWFQVDPGRGRPDKRFCSNACSMRAYRKRKKAQE